MNLVVLDTRIYGCAIIHHRLTLGGLLHHWHLGLHHLRLSHHWLLHHRLLHHLWLLHHWLLHHWLAHHWLLHHWLLHHGLLHHHGLLGLHGGCNWLSSNLNAARVLHDSVICGGLGSHGRLLNVQNWGVTWVNQCELLCEICRLKVPR